MSVPMIESRRSVYVVCPGARTPPTELRNRVSPVNTDPSAPVNPPGAVAAPARAESPRASATSNDSIPAVCPGVCSGLTSRAPKASVSPASMVPVACSTRSRSRGWTSTVSPGQRCCSAPSSATWSAW